MSKLERFKDYSPNEINEKDKIDFDITYEIQGRDANGDIYNIDEDDDTSNYNPFDLEEMVKLLMNKQEMLSNNPPNLFIVKVTSKRIPDEEIERIKISFTTNKYNI